MIKLPNISIRNKLVLIQVFTSIFVLAIFFTGFIVTDIKDYKERKVRSMQGIARVIAANCISTLQFQDSEEAVRILSELKTVAPEITHALITNREGKYFAAYSRNNKGLPNGYLPHNSNFEFEGNHLFISNDILTASNERIGKVFIESELTELIDIKRSKFAMAGISLAVALGFGFLIAGVVQMYISRRLLFLVNTMQEVSRTHNFNITLKDDGKDEISTLYKVYNELMQRVRESQQRKDEFIGIASHELKTPLTSIKGYIELLENMEQEEPNRHFVKKAAENVVKLESLIRDLLDVSKINSGQMQLNFSEFNLDELIDESIATMEAGLKSEHQLIRVGNFNNMVVRADRQRIEQVLLNLLSNAIKYSPDKSTVMVCSKTREKEIEIEVKDFGKGIPEADLYKIFERFFRSKNTSAHVSGFGLGLYICRDIIRRHNGKIWATSGTQGSSFYFSLPMHQLN